MLVSTDFPGFPRPNWHLFNKLRAAFTWKPWHNKATRYSLLVAWLAGWKRATKIGSKFTDFFAEQISWMKTLPEITVKNQDDETDLVGNPQLNLHWWLLLGGGGDPNHMFISDILVDPVGWKSRKSFWAPVLLYLRRWWVSQCFSRIWMFLTFQTTQKNLRFFWLLPTLQGLYYEGRSIAWPSLHSPPPVWKSCQECIGCNVPFLFHLPCCSDSIEFGRCYDSTDPLVKSNWKHRIDKLR